MANINSPYGFLPYRNLTGRGIPQETAGTLSNTTYFVGQPVRTTATSYVGTNSVGVIGVISPPSPNVTNQELSRPCAPSPRPARKQGTSGVWSPRR